jgi:hypothetical protein
MKMWKQFLKSIYKAVWLLKKTEVLPARKTEEEIKRERLLNYLVCFTGLTHSALEDYAVYFKISLEDMRDYYSCFGRLPEPDYVMVIRHIGVQEIIKAVQDGQSHC